MDGSKRGPVEDQRGHYHIKFALYESTELRHYAADLNTSVASLIRLIVHHKLAEARESGELSLDLGRVVAHVRS